MALEEGDVPQAEEAENARTGNEDGRDTGTPPRERWMNRAAAGRRYRAIEAMAGLRCVGWRRIGKSRGRREAWKKIYSGQKWRAASAIGV